MYVEGGGSAHMDGEIVQSDCILINTISKLK